ncbi:DeoR/GlpR family DNA-binding transcription regulator [Planctobacterium marinum]|uniref:DeoR/GlpR family DNA-binding transcription regulator n=1 Tax=Planctobacterium marinum TaxID=1631968 RepID=UPI0030C757EB
MKRNTQQRRRQIVSILELHGEQSVESLANQFTTSEVTIRKDLAALEQNGLVLRRHGGAILAPGESKEIIEKVSKRKMSIAQAAAALIKDHDRILIDSGNTTHAMVSFLKAKRGLVVMTNSLSTAQDVLDLEPEPTLLMTGGTWDVHSQSFQGAMAEQMVSSYNFDLAFVGASGLDLSRGTTTFNELTQLTLAMTKVARKTVVLAESEKFQRKMPNLELSWQQITTLITDDQISESAHKTLTDMGIAVEIVTI